MSPACTLYWRYMARVIENYEALSGYDKSWVSLASHARAKAQLERADEADAPYRAREGLPTTEDRAPPGVPGGTPTGLPAGNRISED